MFTLIILLILQPLSEDWFTPVSMPIEMLTEPNNNF